MMTIKRKVYSIVLKMMLKDRIKLQLTGKQKSQIEALIAKCEGKNPYKTRKDERHGGAKYER